MNLMKQFYCFLEGENNESGGAGNSEISSESVSSISQLGQDFIKSIPEAYQSSPHILELAKSDNPQETLWSKFTSMHDAITNRPDGLPALDAPIESWTKWADSVAPENTNVYGDIKPQLSEDKQHLKEVIEGLYSSEFVNPLLETARKVGIQPFQLQELAKSFNENNLKAAEALLNQQQLSQMESEKTKLEQQKAQDAAFDKYCLEKFGTQRSEIVGKGFEFLNKYVDPQVAEGIKALPNEQLAAVAAFAYNVQKQFTGENRLPSVTASPTQDLVNTEKDLSSKLSELMSHKAYANSYDPQHEAIVAQVNMVAEQVAKLGLGRTKY